MKNLLLIFILSFTFQANAQMFNKTFGWTSSDDMGIGAFQLSDSSYILIGSKSLNQLHKLHISPYGVLLADTQISWAPQQNTFIYKESDQYFYVSDFGFMRKFDSSGATMWIGNYQVYYALYNPLHGLNRLDIYGSYPDSYRILLKQVDSSNTILRTDTIVLDSNLDYLPFYTAELTDHSIAVINKRDNDTIPMGYTLLRCDSNGQLLWRTDLPADTFTPAQMVALPDTGFVISGVKVPQTGNGFHIFLTRYDKNGNVIWHNLYPHLGIYYAFECRLLPDGGFIIGCEGHEPTATTQDVLIYRIDSSGNLLWRRSFGTPGFDYFKSVIQTLDNGFLICGTTVVGNDDDFWLIKTDSLGFDTLQTTGLPESASTENSVHVYPNPSTGKIVINASDMVFMRIIDHAGRTIIHQYVFGTEQVSIDYPGIYFVEVTDKNGVRSVNKIVVF
jgi:hypothetical protein